MRIFPIDEEDGKDIIFIILCVLFIATVIFSISFALAGGEHNLCGGC
jgi:hypothetical protein